MILGKNAFACEKQFKDNFLNIQFSSLENATYRKNGFIPFISLTEAFKNTYTQTNDEKLQVRAMKAEDVYNVTGMSALEEGGTDFKNGKYNELLVFGTDYWLATAYNDYNLWRVVDDGRIYAVSNREYGIRPVVSLKTIIKTTGYNLDGIWNIKL